MLIPGCDEQIKDTLGNEYGKAKDAVGETRMAFTSHADAAFDVCLDNTLTEGAYSFVHSVLASFMLALLAHACSAPSCIVLA